MVRTRKKVYPKDGAQEDHRQAARSRRIADHVGKRSHGTFDRFQDLPCELRLMVWAAAMTPRLVAVKPRPCPKKDDPQRGRKNREISLIRGIPALLAVNQEARHIALRHYTWRFTMDYELDYPDSDLGRSFGRRARVVMSPDDTLGFFLCKGEGLGRVQLGDFEVKVANEKSGPWRIHETTDAPNDEHWFKKVAILGSAIGSNLNVVRALNITVWDLDSILHLPSAGVRTARSPHTKHNILVESREDLDISIPGWPPILPIADILDRDGKSLDILAVKIAEGEEGRRVFDNLLQLIARHALP